MDWDSTTGTEMPTGFAQEKISGGCATRNHAARQNAKIVESPRASQAASAAIVQSSCIENFMGVFMVLFMVLPDLADLADLVVIDSFKDCRCDRTCQFGTSITGIKCISQYRNRNSVSRIIPFRRLPVIGN
jgi:hypothetical protein